jgi:glycerol-3-phosphate acyltransferase PlsY
MLKGLIPALLAVSFDMPNATVAAAGLAAFLGHLYPLYYGFSGGKGVATLLGVLIGTQWLVGLGIIVIWLVMAFTFKYSSLSALIAAFCAPLLMAYVTHSTVLISTTAIMSLLLFWRHRSNIANLLSGNEGKIGAKKST